MEREYKIREKIPPKARGDGNPRVMEWLSFTEKSVH